MNGPQGGKLTPLQEPQMTDFIIICGISFSIGTCIILWILWGIIEKLRDIEGILNMIIDLEDIRESKKAIGKGQYVTLEELKKKIQNIQGPDIPGDPPENKPDTDTAD